MASADLIPVLNPDKSHAYYALEADARALLHAGRAVALGNKREIYAVRMLAWTDTHNEMQMHSIKAHQLKGVPVVSRRKDPGVNEMLAPSPRRSFYWDKAVWKTRKACGLS